ncbi:MAG: conjugal transfer protein TraH [Methyloglobulus sp.]|nr:conjugal transfer protein TraH [Methyloglobulus sp.]
MIKLLPFLMLLLFFIALPAKANLDQELQSAFSSMINVTPGGAYETQRRGVITGGSIAMRNNIMNPNLISFVPPSVKGGCNGIDLFAGSFSFINGAQFTQLMRSVAQAAIGYAFMLAIEGMCPTCAQIMSKLQGEVGKLNSLMRNSCEFAKGMVNATGLKAWADERKQEASSISTGIGIVDDFFAVQENSTEAPAKALIASGNANQITGNVVYESLTQSNTASWFANGDQQLIETLMSLTGTVIVSPKTDNSDIKFDFRPNLLKVKDIIEGGSVVIYKCESDQCLLPDDVADRQTIILTGIRARAREMVWGTGLGATGSGGIVRKMLSKNIGGDFTSSEKQFIQASRPGVYGLLRGLASEIQSANLIADQLVDVVATEMTNQIVDEMFDSVSAAVKSTGKPLDTQMEKVMGDVRAQINEARRVNGESIQGINTLVQLQKTIRDDLRLSMNNKSH